MPDTDAGPGSCAPRRCRYENVISGPGTFVTGAASYADYPDRIRQKLLRGLTKQTAGDEALR
nr:DUF1194 domain-containing protein [uncultured Mameliella sp.]